MGNGGEIQNHIIRFAATSRPGTEGAYPGPGGRGRKVRSFGTLAEDALPFFFCCVAGVGPSVQLQKCSFTEQEFSAAKAPTTLKQGEKW